MKERNTSFDRRKTNQENNFSQLFFSYRYGVFLSIEFFADYQGLQYGDNFPSTNTQRESWSCIISSKVRIIVVYNTL